MNMSLTSDEFMVLFPDQTDQQQTELDELNAATQAGMLQGFEAAAQIAEGAGGVRGTDVAELIRSLAKPWARAKGGYARHEESQRTKSS